MPLTSQSCALLWQRPAFHRMHTDLLVRVYDKAIKREAVPGHYLRHAKAQRLHGLPQNLKWPSETQQPQNTSCTGASMAAARIWPSHLKMPAMPACRCIG